MHEYTPDPAKPNPIMRAERAGASTSDPRRGFAGTPEEIRQLEAVIAERIKREPVTHRVDCALVTTHHLTCTCGAYTRHRSGESSTTPEPVMMAGEEWFQLGALTDEERRLLAITARTQSNYQDDQRYREEDVVKRDQVKRRWRAIADTLHPDPYGEKRRDAT
jgi:hypothetical protein